MPRPNILLITCHDLGRFLGCYGVNSVATPAVDQIAAEGILFSRHFCVSPGCSPSRAALATGRYPHANGVLGLAHYDFGWSLAQGEKHIARLLGEAGYRTALFGLQHVSTQPQTLGFHEVWPHRPADEVAAALPQFLAQQREREVPFFVEINFFEPHRPFDFGGVAPDTSRGVTVPPFLPDNEEVRAEISLMQGAIAKMDRAIAQIDAALTAAGARDETLLVFTADHGVAFPRAKCTLYDPGIESALIIRWPDGGAAPGSSSDALLSNVDILPTLLDAAGLERPADLQGRSFHPLLVRESYETRDAIFVEKTFHSYYDPQRAVRTDRWKLILRFEKTPIEVPADAQEGAAYRHMALELALEGPRMGLVELYDLNTDPWERTNLAGSPEHAEIQANLTSRVHDWMKETGDPLLRGPIWSPFYTSARAALEF